LFLAAPGAHAGKLMALNSKGRPEPGRMAAVLKTAISEFRPDLVGLDPFVKTHSVSENDNAAIDDIAQILADLAIAHDIAVDTPHHARKGPAVPGDADRGRGAGAMRDAFRLTSTLTVMSSEEAAAFGVVKEERKTVSTRR
jgi:RecA-family ATPase